MATSFATLASSTAYLTLLTQINDRDAALALALDPANVTVTSPLTNSVRYSSANKRWELYSGAAWGELIAAATDAFAMTVTGLRAGTLYGASALAAAATLTGGAGSSIDVPTLKQAGSAVWTAATLTNLNQLTNGPAFITASSLSGYAPLASPTFTGVPAAPTAAVNTNTTQLATTAFVLNQSYLTAATAASTYAPLGGGGASGTWGINIVGNAATAGGFTPSATAGAASRIVVADASGYINNNYFNGIDEGTTGNAGTVSGILTKRGDNYYRTTNAASVATYLSGQAMNIAGSSTSCSGNAASASAVAWSGVTSKPINSVTTTTSTSTPTGGTAGDIVFGY